jgi:hypothetical protein
MLGRRKLLAAFGLGDATNGYTVSLSVGVDTGTAAGGGGQAPAGGGGTPPAN